jgi:hypothetical protein
MICLIERGHVGMVSFNWVCLIIWDLFNYLGGLVSYPVVVWITYWARIESRIGSCYVGMV